MLSFRALLAARNRTRRNRTRRRPGRTSECADDSLGRDGDDVHHRRRGAGTRNADTVAHSSTSRWARVECVSSTCAHVRCCIAACPFHHGRRGQGAALRRRPRPAEGPLQALRRGASPGWTPACVEHLCRGVTAGSGVRRTAGERGACSLQPPRHLAGAIPRTPTPLLLRPLTRPHVHRSTRRPARSRRSCAWAPSAAKTALGPTLRST